MLKRKSVGEGRNLRRAEKKERRQTQWRQKSLGRALGAGMGQGFTAGQRPPEVWGPRWLMRPPCRDVLLSFC